MRALPLRLALALPLAAAAAPAAAQLGEVQLGVVASYGAPEALGPGAGPVAGVALGRLVYTGLRFTVHRGLADETGVESPSEVRTRAQVLTFDLGLLIPVRGLEVVPGFSFGVAWFEQPGSTPRHATEVVAAPGIAVHAHVAKLVVIPEFQYFLPGSPDLSWPVDTRGPVASLRIVIPIEVRRIRY